MSKIQQACKPISTEDKKWFQDNGYKALETKECVRVGKSGTKYTEPARFSKVYYEVNYAPQAIKSKF